MCAGAAEMPLPGLVVPPSISLRAYIGLTGQRLALDGVRWPLKLCSLGGDSLGVDSFTGVDADLGVSLPYATHR